MFPSSPWPASQHPPPRRRSSSPLPPGPPSPSSYARHEQISFLRAQKAESNASGSNFLDWQPLKEVSDKFLQREEVEWRKEVKREKEEIERGRRKWAEDVVESRHTGRSEETLVMNEEEIEQVLEVLDQEIKWYDAEGSKKEKEAREILGYECGHQLDSRMRDRVERWIVDEKRGSLKEELYDDGNRKWFLEAHREMRHERKWARLKKKVEAGRDVSDEEKEIVDQGEDFFLYRRYLRWKHDAIVEKTMKSVKGGPHPEESGNAEES